MNRKLLEYRLLLVIGGVLQALTGRVLDRLEYLRARIQYEQRTKMARELVQHG